MGSITIEGGHRLSGETVVQGAKNSVLPVLAATLLCGGACRIRRCPHLSDVDAAADILRYLGCRADWEDGDLLVDSSVLTRCDIPQTLMRRMRSSVIFLGAILARCGWAELSYPGGCELGPRPIDLHLAALRTLGASIEESGGKLYCQGRHLRGGQIVLAIPSVGATENAILAACGAEGVTVITNAAREPEIADLQDFLCACGAEVRGAGGSVITVEGRRPGRPDPERGHLPHHRGGADDRHPAGHQGHHGQEASGHLPGDGRGQQVPGQVRLCAYQTKKWETALPSPIFCCVVYAKKVQRIAPYLFVLRSESLQTC